MLPSQSPFFTFTPAIFDHKDVIFQWLDLPHVVEFWDNCPEHRLDIVNFMEGRRTPSPYFNGEHNNYYWMGYINDDPFTMIMTSEFIPEKCAAEESPYTPYLSKTGKTFGIDFMIGNPTYLGKGLAAPTLQAFMAFFKDDIEPLANTFIIDPDDNNPRARHVYNKAGFKKMDEFIMPKGYFEGAQFHLMVMRFP